LEDKATAWRDSVSDLPLFFFFFCFNQAINEC
jgi:hypothetical protein